MKKRHEIKAQINYTNGSFEVYHSTFSNVFSYFKKYIQSIKAEHGFKSITFTKYYI